MNALTSVIRQTPITITIFDTTISRFTIVAIISFLFLLHDLSPWLNKHNMPKSKLQITNRNIFQLFWNPKYVKQHYYITTKILFQPQLKNQIKREVSQIWSDKTQYYYQVITAKVQHAK